MIVIGITGPTGAGKGTISELLYNEYGFPIIDADKIYHALVDYPSNCVDEIEHVFGDSVIAMDGSLDRHALGKLVFGENNRDKLLLLNKITHKYVVEEIKNLILFFSDKCEACVIDAPLLIEADLCHECDFTISVLADAEIRAKRISRRDKINYDEAIIRISSQKADDFYIRNTDYNVSNNEDASLLDIAIHKILSERRVID